MEILNFNFGDPQNGKYLKFDADSRNPGKLLISFGSWLLSTCMAAAAVSLQVNHLHFFFFVYSLCFLQSLLEEVWNQT